MLKNRFLSVFALAFAAGIAVMFLAGSEGEAVCFICFAVLMGLLSGGYFWAHVRCRELKVCLLYPLLIAAGLFCGSGWLLLRSVPYAACESFVGSSDTVEGTVTESGSSAGSGYIELRIDRSKAALPKGTHIRLYTDAEQEIHIGDRVGAEVTYLSLSGSQQRATGVKLTAEGTILTVRGSEGMLASLRSGILRSCYALYDSYGVSGTAQTLLVRERSGLSEKTTDAYRNAGLAHLLAISGLHLTILVEAFRRLLSLFRVRKQVREAASLLLLLFYCFLTGFSPSIVRASVMLGFVLFGEITLFRGDQLTALFSALLLLLLGNPYSLLSSGLQLSFLSCLGIVLLSPSVLSLQLRIAGGRKARFHRLRKGIGAMAGSFLLSYSAVIFTFPVTVFRFGTVAYLAPLSNLLILPFFAPMLSLLMLSVALFPVFPLGAGALAFLPGCFFRLLEHGLVSLTEKGIGSVEISGVRIVFPVLLSVAAILAMLLPSKRSFRLHLSIFIIFALSLAVCILPLQSAGCMPILTVSAEDGYVLSINGTEVTLLDLGLEQSSLSFPDDQEVPSIDAYIVSEATAAAQERLETVLALCPVARVYLPVFSREGIKNDLSSLKALAKRKKCDIIEYHYTVETEALLYDALHGYAKAPYSITVLLFGKDVPPISERVVLLPAYEGDISTLPPEVLYLPVDWEGSLPAGSVHFYKTVVTLQGKEGDAS